MVRRRFLLAGAASLAAAEEPPVEIRSGGRVAAAFYSGESWDKPFLYPIQTVSGKLLSRGWPIQPRQGDSNDHPWHRGIWYGHGLINGADFWRELGRDKTARLVRKAAPRAQTSAVAVDLAMVPPSGKPIGSMRQEYRLADTGSLRQIDAIITIHADQRQNLTFGDTEDGGFGFRLSEAFREDRGARLRNSEGLAGTAKIWGQPARWVDYSATIDGAPAGVAILDHPSNLRHPTRWHARGYGLNAANPFALRDFSKNPSADGRHILIAGERLEFRYRVLVYEGAPDLAALFQEFARS